MINAELVGNEVKITFKYTNTEYCKIVIGKLKEFGATWHPIEKFWSLPATKKASFHDKFKEYLLIWKGEEQVTGGGIKESTISDQPIVPGYSVTYDDEGRVVDSIGWKVPPIAEYQVRGFNALVSRNFLVLADDMGLGKTWMMATAMEARKKLGQIKRGIVVCKASLLYNWYDEVKKFTNLRPVILTGTRLQRCNLHDKLKTTDDWDVIITSYETYRVDVSNLQNLDNIKTLDFLTIDEAHKISTPTTQIGTCIHYIPYPCKYILTGSPLPNTPLQAFNYFKLGGKISANWWQFQNRYAIFGGFNNKEVVGYKNITELHDLFNAHMLRRLKRDKLKELPEVMFRDIRVDMTTKQANLYKAVKKEIMDELKDTSLGSIPTALTKLLRLQQVVNHPLLVGAEGIDSGKLEALDDLLEDLVDEGDQKVIIFSRFREMTKILKERYKKYNPAYIDGEVDAKTRHEEVKRFQSDDSCQVFIGSTLATAEGITLTASSHVIFYDLPWNYATYSQCFSRAHRIGQKSAVTVYNLIGNESIDEHVYKIVQSKKHISETLLDKKLEGNDDSTYDIKDFIRESLK